MLFFNECITEMNEKQVRNHRITNIGFIFQEFELLEYLSVIDNLLLPYKINQTLDLTKEVIEKAKETANKIGIGSKLKDYPKYLRWRTPTTCHSESADYLPPLIIADEPTGNLDAKTSSVVMNEITSNFLKQIQRF